MGCYDDFENADAFVLWGSNMAEMHPILWTRVIDRRLSHPSVRVLTLSTYEHRTTELSDQGLIFKPGTDLAILNYIANYIIQNGAVNREFVDKHVNFRTANTDIGYGLRPEHVLEQRATHANDAAASQASNFDAYAKMVAEYTLEKTADLSGVSKERLLESRQRPTPIPRSRSCRSGRWGSTSMSAASGLTTSSTIFTC